MNKDKDLREILQEPGALLIVLVFTLALPKLGIVTQEFMDVMFIPFSAPFYLFWIIRKMRKGKRVPQKYKLTVTIISSFLIFMGRKLPKSFEQFFMNLWTFLLAAVVFTIIAYIFYMIQEYAHKLTELDMRVRLLISLLVTGVIGTLILEGFSFFDIFGVVG